MQKKVEYNREMALSSQQVEFSNKKISELETILAEANERYEEKLTSFKD